MTDKSVAILDVRSSEIAVLYGERGVNHTFVFKASDTQAYSGYEDGAFYDEKELSEAVHRAVAAVEQTCGIRLRDLYVGVPGEFTLALPAEQSVSFPKRTRIERKTLDAMAERARPRVEGYRHIRTADVTFVTADNRRESDPVGSYATGLSGVFTYFFCSEYFAERIEAIFSGTRVALHFLPTEYAMCSYLIPPETRDECAMLADVGFLSTTVCVVLGNGLLAQSTFWVGRGQIAVRLMQRFSLPYDAALALLSKANLNMRKGAKDREFTHQGAYYSIPVKDLIEEIKAGLDGICEKLGGFLEECSGKELDNKPLYVTGDGLDGIRGALEYMTQRLDCVCEQIAPDLPYYNRPAMSSRVSLIDMAYEDHRKCGFLYRLLNLIGG